MAQRAGFTVVELVAGLGLSAVLAGIGGVQLVTLVSGIRLAGAARTLASDLRLARGHALAAGLTVDVLLDGAAGTWEARERGGRSLETRTLPPGVGFGALPARGRLRFDGLGTADNGTVTLAATGGTRSVIVNQRGRVRVQ